MIAGMPDTKNGWFKVAKEWALILCHAPLNALEFRIVWWWMLNSYGVRAKNGSGEWLALKRCHYTIYRIYNELNTDRGSVRRAVSRLVSAGVFLVPEKGVLELNRDWHSWTVWGRRTGKRYETTLDELLGRMVNSKGESEDAGAPAPEPDQAVGDIMDPEPPPAPAPAPASKNVTAPSGPDAASRAIPKKAEVAPAGKYAPTGVPPWDPVPGKPYSWPKQLSPAGDWFYQPWVPLPGFDDVKAMGEKAVKFRCTLRPDEYHDRLGHFSERGAPARFLLVWEAIVECDRNLAEPRSLAQSDDGRRFIWDEVLPAARAAACVRDEPGDDHPRTIASALARVRVLVAMCDPEDESDEYWVGRVKTTWDLAKCLPKMLEQVGDARWRDREDRRVSEWLA